LRGDIEVDEEGNQRVIHTVFILLEEVEEGTPAGSLAPDADVIEHGVLKLQFAILLHCGSLFRSSAARYPALV
jgi:hypothetical protein